MESQSELSRIAKKLEKITNRKDTSSAAQATDLLKTLQGMKVTLDMIQKTRIGLIINNLRKSIQDDDVSVLSKSLIKTWKKMLNDKDNGSSTARPSGDGGGGGNTSTTADYSSDSSQSHQNNSNSKNNSSSTNGSSKTGNHQKQSQPNQQSTRRNLPSNFPPRQTSFPANTADSVRLKCREMLSNALKPDVEMEAQANEEGDSGGFYDHENLGAMIEDFIFKEFKDTNQKYKNRVRSRVSNLNDKKNPDLKLNVLRGHIKPERIAVMTAEEMASNEMKQLRSKFTKEAINDAQMSMTGGTKTDLIKCPACKRNNCTYNQVQTRSADEPMTTFCYCNECGKRWKFC